MRVTITGAAGVIGVQLTEELALGHELRLIDKVPAPGGSSWVADLSVHRVGSPLRPWSRQRRPGWTQIFEGVDVVLHLAHDRFPAALWTQAAADNVQATWNVLEAAASHGVPRVVYASSNWAVKFLEEHAAPDCYLPSGPKIGSDAPPRPRTAYGLSKAVGELVGQMFVDEGRLTTFIAVRIGNCAREVPSNPIKRTRWIGFQDIRRLFRCCVETPVTGFHVVYGVSRQPAAPYDLSHTSRLLGWVPIQTA
jgi:uronate dehydrogenase